MGEYLIRLLDHEAEKTEFIQLLKVCLKIDSWTAYCEVGFT